ncbi:Glucose/ribitol dehydrogenase [Penicillium robsamsonii]|uniref:Glucose/ribitol dehydrogenase n=1 Tax=Penicillium robsamsonii TaxID=1792511 RepID=UPI002547F7BC|nr:Glucose/ribitol dehydrogenase [Penicillium robsamsonii]KAJ5816552.1 Glucose/ribitol dehydrogenase [Penicillium robsamsonii]
MPSIAGQSLLVIGGSSGIGAAVARLAAEQGVRVSIASSNPARVANAVTRIKSESPATMPDTNIKGFAVDLAQPDVEQRLEQLLADATADGSELLDHIVVTAGQPATRPLARTDRDYLFDQAQLILVAPILVAKLAPRFLKPSYTSSVVFCGGRLGEKPIKGWPTGAAYAAGLDGLTRALALDLAPLRVNVVHPGPTETEIWGEMPEQRKSTREFYASTALLGKVGTPEEVAEAFIYLLRDSNITGTSIHSSGGVLVQ